MRVMFCARIVLVFLFFTHSVAVRAAGETSFNAFVGTTVALPCTVDTKQCGALHSVKWYRDMSRIYVFSHAGGIARAEGDATDSDKKIRFDVFEKVEVNGKNALPLWKYLKYKKPGTTGQYIKWNFTKFIIDRMGQPVERHGPSTPPKDLVRYLEKYW